MRNLFRFIIRNNFIFLFLLLEGIAFILIVQYNSFQKSKFVKHSRNISLAMNANLKEVNQYFNLREQNDILSAENARLRNLLEMQKYNTNDTVNNADGDLTPADTSVRINYHYLPARVVNISVNKQNNFITIDKGTLQGVYPEMAVISDLGAVGIIVKTSENFSRVLPVLNRNFRLSAKIKRNNYFGIIEWDGISSDIAPLKEVPVHVDIHTGDTIVTSGYSAIFPEGINVGVVDKVSPTDGNFNDVKVRLLTDFRNLTHVYLVKYYFKDEHQALENDNIER